MGSKWKPQPGFASVLDGTAYETQGIGMSQEYYNNINRMRQMEEKEAIRRADALRGIDPFHSDIARGKSKFSEMQKRISYLEDSVEDLRKVLEILTNDPEKYLDFMISEKIKDSL